ncbi:hypothetical protein LEMLEM_LOCUS8825 [Lemmus lemmus]
MRAGRCSQPARNHYQGIDPGACLLRPPSGHLVDVFLSPSFLLFWVARVSYGNPPGFVTEGVGLFISPMRIPVGWRAWLT